MENKILKIALIMAVLFVLGSGAVGLVWLRKGDDSIGRKQRPGRTSELLYGLGMELMKNKNTTEAHAVFDKIRKDFPQSPESFLARLEIGKCTFEEGGVEKAIDYYYSWIASEDDPTYLRLIYTAFTRLLETIVPQKSENSG